jgi:ribonuclease P protein component
MRAFDSLRGRREFTLVIRRGTPVARGSLTIYGFRPRGAMRPKLGVVIPKTVGKAVRRNLLRRRCKAIFEDARWEPPHHWYVIACRPGAAALTFAELKSHLTSAVADAGRARHPAPVRQRRGRS